jgi:hypothetical protein
MRFLVLGLALLLTACPRGAPTPAAPLDSEPDAGGEPDGGTGGEGEGEGEGEPPDAGENADGGADAGVLDAGAADAGVFDAGPQFPSDGGPEPLCEDPALHNGGDGTCVAVGVCSADYFLRPDGRCTAWRATAPLPGALGTLRLLVRGGALYVVGAHENGSTPNELWTSVVDGELAPWQPFVKPRRDASQAAAALSGDRLVLVGGMDERTWATSAVVSMASFGDDGVPRDWVVSATSLLVPRRLAMAFVWNETLFVHGGMNGNDILSTLEAIPLLPDGTLGAPTLIGATPSPMTSHHALLLGDAQVLFAGDTGTEWVMSAGSGFPDVWESTPGHGVTEAPCILLAGDRLIAIGGLQSFANIGSKTSDLTFSASLHDGLVGEWEPRGPLDIDRMAGDCAQVDDFLIVVGGTRARFQFRSTELVSIARLDAVLRSVEAP